jgi:prepilin-type N-terminal cleavage/methylation domain-containing protein
MGGENRKKGRWGMKTRRGVTLVELLIVVAVMVVLMAIALPAAKTGVERSRLRSAASIVQQQIRLARSVAVETGRPASIRLSGDGSAVFSIDVLSSPLSNYAGDMVDSRAIVSIPSPGVIRCRLEDAMAGSVVNIGDVFRFDYKWGRYRVVGKSQQILPSIPDPLVLVPVWIFDLAEDSPLPIPVGKSAQWLFVVTRKPDAVVSSASLPGIACIDLSGSGYGTDDDTFATGGPVAAPLTIDFDASGAAVAVRFGTVEHVLLQPLNLLIGEVDDVGIRVGTVAENVTNGNALWVSIPRSGDATVKPNGWSVSRPTLVDSRTL